MTLARNDQDWSILLNEYNVCKKKLESKREGLKILMKDLEKVQVERDIQKNKVTQLEAELNDLKSVLRGCWQGDPNSRTTLNFQSEEKKTKILNNLLQFSRDENLRLQHDFDNLRKLYAESQHDNQLLRGSLSKYEAQKKIGSHQRHDKEKLIVQLEDALAKITVLEQELQIRKDEQKELEEERTSFREKYTRLNTELNYILHNDDRRIIDVDTIVLENQYLKEVVKQYKEEKAIAVQTVSRYKDTIRQRNSLPKTRLSYLDLISPTSTQHEGFFTKTYNQNTVSELQRVNQALTEKVSEKDLALKHQRNTNRILGTRVSELEKKLKTLEISGLWSHEQRFPRDAPRIDDTTFSSDIIQPTIINNHATCAETNNSVVGVAPETNSSSEELLDSSGDGVTARKSSSDDVNKFASETLLPDNGLEADETNIEDEGIRS